MPDGRIRGLGRLIAGLLVLTVLLFSGVHASVTTVPSSHHHQSGSAVATVAAAIQGVSAPNQDGDCDHGLCRDIGRQCLMHAYWIPATAVDLQSLPKVGVVRLFGRARSFDGVAVEPSSPPPRVAV
jgi:hypothetical protein